MIHHGSRGAYLAGVGEGIREGHGNSGTFCGAGKDNQEGGFSPGPKAGLAKKGRVKAGQARLIGGFGKLWGGLILEAAARFELAHKGFADLCLTAWLRRRWGMVGP